MILAIETYKTIFRNGPNLVNIFVNVLFDILGPNFIYIYG